MPPIESVDLLIEPRWLLPIAPANRALRGHALAVRDGKIVAVGPSDDLLTRFAPLEHLVRESHALLPGFVNAHTEAAMCLLRGLPANRPLMPWLHSGGAAADQPFLNAAFVRDGTRLGIAEMLRAGITAFADRALFPEEAARVAAAARIRAVIGLPIAQVASASAQDANGYFAGAERLWDEYHANPWVSLQFAPHAPGSLEDDTLMRMRRLADELDARIVLPMLESAGEISDGIAYHGKRPLHRLDELGLLRPGVTVVPATLLNDEDLERLARRGVAVVICPQSNLRFGNGRCELDTLLAQQLTLGLGTDTPASVGALDMLAESRAAALCNPRHSAADVLRLATLGGAAALGLAADIGSLEPGKAADFICIDLDTLACQSDAAVLDSVVFGATRQQVSDVWIGGRAAVAAGRLLAFDERELLELARSWSEHIHGAQS